MFTSGVLHQMNKLIQSTVIDLSTKKKMNMPSASPAPGIPASPGASAPPSAAATPAASAPPGAFALQGTSSSAQPGLVPEKSKDDPKQSSPAPQL